MVNYWCATLSQPIRLSQGDQYNDDDVSINNNNSDDDYNDNEDDGDDNDNNYTDIAKCWDRKEP